MISKDENLGEHLTAALRGSVNLYSYLLVGFLVPFTIGHPQLLVGALVNATLVLGAVELGSARKIVPLLFAPSLGVLARGLIFGPFTPFLAVMLPFIWLGNAILVFGVREFYRKRKVNYGITLGVFSAAKAGFLFSVAFVLVSATILPPVFLAAMGSIQLITALVGGIAAFGLHKSGITRLLDF